MKYGLFAAIAFALVALVGGTASAGVAASGVTKMAASPTASIVQHAPWHHNRCYRHCRAHGHSRWRCHRRCGW